jgi:RNA polymerase sigma-70 factor (ECF subfamily)
VSSLIARPPIQPLGKAAAQSSEQVENVQGTANEAGGAQRIDLPSSGSVEIVEGAQLLATRSDENLMALICEGEKEAFASLFRRYARSVRGVAYRVLRDTSEADDLVQDLFLLVHRDCKMFNSSKGSARFWILQMAYRRAISRRRYLTSRHFYTRLDLEDAASQLADPRTRVGQIEDSMDARLGNGCLQKVFETLSENQRQTLRLFFTEGYKLDEIAAKLGQSRGNVKHHYFRGLERLRKELFDGKLPGERAV